MDLDQTVPKPGHILLDEEVFEQNQKTFVAIGVFIKG